jgi:predicted peptidase
LNDVRKRVNYSLFSDSGYWEKQVAKQSAQSLRRKIASFNHFPEAPQKDWWTLYRLKVNDSLEISYLVHIPEQYNVRVRTPLYVFLHGGVGRTSFSNPLDEIRLETPLLESAFREQAFVILPLACKSFNWLYHQQAFEAIVQEIVQMKGLYNIDDNKVYIGGHSDGARGAFWFALNGRTPFAAFFGLNYFPILLTGNTPLRNLRNEAPFEGISGIEDKGFNIKQVTQIVNYARLLGANWHMTNLTQYSFYLTKLSGKPEILYLRK